MRAWVLCLLAALGGGSAGAHIVPVPPSACAFDPVALDAPNAGVAVTAAPAVPADQFRILYDPQASQAQFDLTGKPPRAFSVAGVDGTLSLPSIFLATLRNSGDLTASPPLVIAMSGSTITVPMHLTTGLAVAAGRVVEGVPLGRDGRFVLTGITADSGLPPPLDGQLLVARLSCTATPRPDTDQFRLATQTTALSAALTARTLRLRAIFAPGAMDQPDFPGGPAILRATSGDTVVATVFLPSGLPRHRGKVFIGRTDDGRAALGVRALRRSGQVVYLLALKVKQPAMPVATAGPVQLAVTFDVGGLLSRVALPLRVKRQGARMTFP